MNNRRLAAADLDFLAALKKCEVPCPAPIWWWKQIQTNTGHVSGFNFAKKILDSRKEKRKKTPMDLTANAFPEHKLFRR